MPHWALCLVLFDLRSGSRSCFVPLITVFRYSDNIFLFLHENISILLVEKQNSVLAGALSCTYHARPNDRFLGLGFKKYW